MELETLYQQLLPILEEAEGIALAKFGTNIEKKYKNDTVSEVAIVTEVDLAIDALLREKLASLFPNVGFITEEGVQGELKEYNWIIDPIDGTMNYSRGLPMFAISIGLWQGNTPMFGLISLPAIKQRMYGFMGGGGVWQNGYQLPVVTPETPRKAYVVLGEAAPPKVMGRLAEAIASSVNNHHDFGSSVYQGFLAINHKVELAVFYNVALWDIGAVLALAKEAGLAIKWVSAEPNLATADPKAYEHTLAIGLPDLVDKVQVALTAIME